MRWFLCIFAFLCISATCRTQDTTGIRMPELYMPEDGVFGRYTEPLDTVHMNMLSLGYAFNGGLNNFGESKAILMSYSHSACRYRLTLLFTSDEVYLGFVVAREADTKEQAHELSALAFQINQFLNATYLNGSERKTDDDYAVEEYTVYPDRGNVIMSICTYNATTRMLTFVKVLTERE